MEERRSKGLKRAGRVAAVAAVLAAGVAVWMAIPPKITAKEPDFGTSADPALVARGKYVAQLGDCVACHTEKGGQEMAGGLALETPMGMIYSTNITPDPKTGIGNWSFGEFDRAMRKGVAADGHNLYPAMPYPSYAKVSEEDMTALWAYLKHGVEPVERSTR